MKDNCLILMVKCPRKGEVKKRLSNSIGETNATEFYRRSGLDMLDTIIRHDFDVRIGFHPPNEEGCIGSWLGSGLDLIPQSGDDLGERQGSLLEKGFDLGYSKVCVMSSDLPDIPVERIHEAFAGLKSMDCVIGPSPDGGYYLIGFSTDGFEKNIFKGMQWSHSNVTDEMRRRLVLQGIEWIEIEPWQDVDDIDDLGDLIKRNPIGTGPVRTMEFLRGLDLP